MPGSRKRSYTHKETADERKNDNLLDFSGYYRKSRTSLYYLCQDWVKTYFTRSRKNFEITGDLFRF